MYKKNAIFSLVFTTAMLLLPLTQAEAGTELGVLTCKKIPGSEKNLLIHSSAGFDCAYKTAGGFEEKYKGEAGIALGLDLSWTKESTIAYTVMGVAKGAELPPGELVGTYTGGTASAAFGLGTGAKVLVGGGKTNVALSPLALEASKGFGASAGIGYLTLVKE
ncbi:MAG: DUF992 domain-containing protein [Gammaproteobacteria bacterium]